MKSSDKRRKGWPPSVHVLWLIPVAAVALIAMSAGPSPARALQQVGPSDTVAIEASCAGGGRLGRVSVDPWTLVVRLPTNNNSDLNTEVVWQLAGGDADSIVVQAKEDGDWPFGPTRHEFRGRGPGQSPSARMRRNLTVRGRRTQADTVRTGDKFAYNVLVYCRDMEDNSIYSVVIDPDIEGGGP